MAVYRDTSSQRLFHNENTFVSENVTTVPSSYQYLISIFGIVGYYVTAQINHYWVETGQLQN